MEKRERETYLYVVGFTFKTYWDNTDNENANYESN